MTTLNKRYEALRYKVVPPKLYYRVRAWRTWLRCQYYSEPEIRLLKYFVEAERNSVDVGANKGIYTYFLERMSRHVFAYEPNPKFTPILRPSVGPNVTLIEAALSDRTGEATLTIPIGPKGESNNAATLVEDKYDWETRELSVPVTRLDDAGHDDIGFVKIDVEGHEDAVVRGAARILAQDRPTLLIEIETALAGKDPRESFELVRSFGYEGYFYLGGKLKSIKAFSAEQHQLDPRAGQGGQYVKNFLFLPHEKPL